MAEKRHRIIALLLALLFVGYYASNTMFEHVHYVDNVMVVHSHPFGGSGHSHTSAGMQAISLLNSAIILGSPETVTTSPAMLLIAIVGFVAAAAAISRHLLSLSLRAPPAVDCNI